MDRKYLVFLAVSMSVMLSGCTQGSLLDSDLSEAEVILSTDMNEIEVEAASFHEKESVTDTLTVISSRSWSLVKADDSPWLTVSRNNGINLGKVIKEWPVALAFEDNTDPSQGRLTEISITIDGKRKILPVRQKEFIPVLSLESPVSYQLPEVGDTVDLAIRCNCSWTAHVAETSDAKVTLGAEGGHKSGILQVIVKANSDVENPKQATITLSAENTEDIIISIAQDVCIPRLEIDAEQTVTDVLPGEGEYQIIFETNESWTAALDEGASEGVSLSTEEGNPGDELFIYFPNATLEGAAATVTITNHSGLAKSLTFTQKGCLFIPFRVWPDNNGWSKHATSLYGLSSGKYDIPRTTDDSKNYLATSDTYVGKDAYGWEYTFYAGSEEAMFRSEHSGLVIGSTTQNPAFHIEFPAIEGKTLKGVRIMLGNSEVKLTNWETTATGTTGRIVDAEGNVVSGGELQQVNTYQKGDDWQTNPDNTAQLLQQSFDLDYYNHTDSMFDFVLTDTQPNTAYRYQGEYRQVIRWFILYYE